jgi:hypothetical protein
VEAAHERGPDEIASGAVALLAQFLGLLAAFIGEDMTLRLVPPATCFLVISVRGRMFKHSPD